MSWFLDPNGKSVAKNAQKIVINLHSQLEKQQCHINQLESLVEELKSGYSQPIQKEIHRLEKIKVEYQNKIIDIDDQIAQYEKSLSEMDLKIEKIFSNKTKRPSLPSHATDDEREATNDLTLKVIPEHRLLSQSFESFSNGNDQEDEHELLEAVRAIEPQVLFVLYRNTTEDVIVYLPPAKQSETLSLYRLRDPSDRQTAEEISSFERMMAYGPSLRSNSDRNEPDMLELPCPGLLTDFGEFVGCLKLPIVTDIKIELWRHRVEKLVEPIALPDIVAPKYWTTVAIGDTKYAVLECLYIKSETRWGFNTVTSIEITARHPVDGRVLREEFPIA
jgi:hypothetical protein